MPDTSDVAALLTPVLACVAAYIAWRQWRTANNKVKLDLFDRRYRVYSEIRSLLSQIFRDATVTTDQLLMFRSSVADSVFLFGADISGFIDAVYVHGVELSTASMRLRDPADHMTSEERKVIAHKARLEMEWFLEQQSVMTIVFAKYLDLSQL